MGAKLEHGNTGESIGLKGKLTVVANISCPQAPHVQLLRSEKVTYAGILPRTAKHRSFLPVLSSFSLLFTDERKRKTWYCPSWKEAGTDSSHIMWQMEDDSKESMNPQVPAIISAPQGPAEKTQSWFCKLRGDCATKLHVETTT